MVAETHHEIADALQDVVILAGCIPIIVSEGESMGERPALPEAIVVRVATEMPMTSPHLNLRQFGRTERTLVVALASSDADVAEAERLGCQVIARAPRQVQVLYEALTQLSSRSADSGRITL